MTHNVEFQGTFSSRMKTSRSEFITIRELRYHIRHWGPEDAPKLFMLHGWMDISASFQFLVDSLQKDWHVIASDWRGFGLTQAAPGHSYWFPNYIGDLDAILLHYSSDEPVYLLGHSMGGNIASIYSGVCPERVKKLINLEGYGLPSARPFDAPDRYRKWLDQLHHPPKPRTFTSRQEVIDLLKRVNPRLTDERAQFLSGHWAGEQDSGKWQVLADPMHRNSSPLLYRAEEALACWSGITAPTLWVESEFTDIWQRLGPTWNAVNTPEQHEETEEERRRRIAWKRTFQIEFERRLSAIPIVERAYVANASHMLHHDQPEEVARLVEKFLG